VSSVFHIGLFVNFTRSVYKNTISDKVENFPIQMHISSSRLKCSKYRLKFAIFVNMPSNYHMIQEMDGWMDGVTGLTTF